MPDAPGTWLLVLPPGATTDCDCQQATALAGEAAEATAAAAAPGEPRVSRPLRPGRVRVHGTRAPHRLRAAGPGYSVTLHWDSQPHPFGIMTLKFIIPNGCVLRVHRSHDTLSGFSGLDTAPFGRPRRPELQASGITLREYRVNHHRG